MEERRIQVRIPLLYYLAVFDRDSDQLIGYIADITSDGALLLTEKPLDKETVYQLKTESFSTSDGNRDIEFNAMCIYHTRGIEIEYYNCGCKFIDIPPETIIEIQGLIDVFKIEE